MFKKFLKKRLNQKGLTLVELLAVVVILGIIAAIAVPAIGGIIDNTKVSAHEANETMVQNAAKLYYLGEMDSTGTQTAASVDTELVQKGYLEAVPEDPDTGSAYTTATFSIDATGKITVDLQ